MPAEIDWPGFAGDVEAALAGRSGRSICGAENGLNPAMVSRARNGEKPLSAASYMALCVALGLDPQKRFRVREAARLHSLKDVLKQRDTANVSRETEAHRHG